MKSGLQYAYSIAVFIGVLITAYFMVDQKGAIYGPVRSVEAPSYRTEATVDPALTQLFEVESAINGLKGPRPTFKRVPTQNRLLDEERKKSPDDTLHLMESLETPDPR